MKGLILHNFYTMRGEIKFTIGFLLFLFLTAWYSRDMTLYLMSIIMPMSFLSSNGVSTFSTDETSKWSKLEVTLPVKRIDIVSSKYFFTIILIPVSYVVSILTILCVPTGLFGISFHDLFLIQIAGLSVALLNAALTSIVFIIFGVYTASIVGGLFGILAMVLVWSVERSVDITSNIIPIPPLNFDWCIPILIVSIILFVLSFFVSVIIFKNKEFTA